MKIRTRFVLRLLNRLSFSETEFEKWFAQGFYDLERILDITPSEYSAAIIEKAKTLTSGVSLDNFCAEVSYFEKRL